MLSNSLLNQLPVDPEISVFKKCNLSHFVSLLDAKHLLVLKGIHEIWLDNLQHFEHPLCVWHAKNNSDVMLIQLTCSSEAVLAQD